MNVKLWPGTMSNLSELGIQTHTTPVEQQHATYERRLLTFNGWPKNLKQTPEMLASAGFYYGGKYFLSASMQQYVVVLKQVVLEQVPVIVLLVFIAMVVYGTGKQRTMHGLNTLDGFRNVNLLTL